jgi:hypothetical protein
VAFQRKREPSFFLELLSSGVVFSLVSFLNQRKTVLPNLQVPIKSRGSSSRKRSSGWDSSTRSGG